LNLTESTSYIENVIASPEVLNLGETKVSTQISIEAMAFDLGVWLVGLTSFLNSKNHPFVDGIHSTAPNRDWTNELKLTKFTLHHISNSASGLVFATKNNSADDLFFGDFESPQTITSGLYFSLEDLNKFIALIRNFSVLGDGLIRSSSISFHEWTAWCNILSNELAGSQTATDLIERAKILGGKSFPVKFQQLIADKQLPSDISADLDDIVPFFNKIFKYLTLIEKMLEEDKPLKPTLLFFAAIYQESQEMMTFIKKRLSQFKSEEHPMFEALDCAVFATSMEIRKVYQNELGDASTIRQAPLLCARIEAAFGLLRDCFQQTFVGFAKFVDPNVNSLDLFRNFNTKLEQSLILRKELWDTLQIVKSAESSPEPENLQTLHNCLTNFTKSSMKFLMYKDLETVERFIGEVAITKNSSDIVPTLHRFSAYLETLFGQVKMRVVLMDHPFEY
jgi:hypothetical protein